MAERAAAGAWPSDHAGLRVLTHEECQRLLRDTVVGRVAFPAEGEVEILPVVYGLDGDAVVFRSTSGAKLSAAINGAAVAFEIDGYDLEQRRGWSVVVKGTAEVIYEGEAADRLSANPTRAWIEDLAAGQAFHWVRIRPYSVTGREIPARQVAAATAAGSPGGESR
ncbi:MAG: pyridoxamine 5'-phosphate oxidase family protein [Frankia sp.]|nr:pyridoxamine 5'-phosphate oxidase family protein [Frankia sp.]